MNIEKLKVLSDEALLALADKMGLIVPTELDRPFLIEALLEAFEEDSEERESSLDVSVHVEQTKYSGSQSDEVDLQPDSATSMETRYNETMVRLLIRDTSWAFAFWDINDEERSALHSAESSFSGFFLRVMEDSGRKATRGGEHFDIAVSEADLQWYINLPMQDSRYRIDLCCRAGGKIRVLAKSNIVHTPRGTLAEGTSAIDVNTAELLALSGFDELNIPIAEERHPSRILSESEVEE